MARTSTQTIPTTNEPPVGLFTQLIGAAPSGVVSLFITDYNVLESFLVSEGENYTRFEAYLVANTLDYTDLEAGTILKSDVSDWFTANP